MAAHETPFLDRWAASDGQASYGWTTITKVQGETSDESAAPTQRAFASGALLPYLARWQQPAHGNGRMGTVLTRERETTDETT
jgi:hypothetical protein